MDKLSEAIRTGAVFHGQCFDWFFLETDADGKISKTSAIGAAIFVTFGDIFLQGMYDGNPKPEQQLKDKFPVLKKQIGTGRERGTVFDWIQVLNHGNRWSREKIAEWLMRIEEEV
jgi:hypothetical protein